MRTAGAKGGSVSASVYDSSLAVFFNAETASDHLVEWIAAQQHADGGWGQPKSCAHYHRAVPTLAAMLALNTRKQAYSAQLQLAEQFIKAETAAPHWNVQVWKRAPTVCGVCTCSQLH